MDPFDLPNLSRIIELNAKTSSTNPMLIVVDPTRICDDAIKIRILMAFVKAIVSDTSVKYLNTTFPFGSNKDNKTIEISKIKGYDIFNFLLLAT
jgi:hypothetical protein